MQSVDSLAHQGEDPTMHADIATVLDFPARDYRVTNVERESLGEYETTRTGATIYSEALRFSDNLGRTTIRNLTLAVPNSNLVDVSPFPIVETDPWTTGERGFNRDKIRAYTDLGYTVLWLHHGGRKSPIQKDKSVSRSAHQMHAMLDHVSGTLDAETDEVIVGGYSRGAMTGEKFIAMADDYGRKVPYSDLDAPCFANDMSEQEKLVALRQLAGEAAGIGRIGARLLIRAVKENDPGILGEYLKTLDLHPRNLVQEFMWAKALVNANVGQAVAALPEDTVGVRNFYSGDIMSQQRKYELLYRGMPGIHVNAEQGPHVAGVYTEILQKKYARLSRVNEFVHSNGMSLYGINAHEIAGSVEPATQLTVVQAS